MAKKKASGKRQPDISLSITEVTIVGGRTKYIRVNIDGQDVRIPVSESVYTQWREQFYRPNPTPLQRSRFGTFINVVKAAYLNGLADGANE